MDIAVIGLSHTTATADIREKVAFTDVKKIEIINALLDEGIEELVLLSTCNRSEMYIATSSEKLHHSIKTVKNTYMSFIHEGEGEASLYIKQGDDAVCHLYKVTAGLDSIVLGEDQILAQVKDAHSFAMNVGSSKKLLNKLFREAVATAKKIKTELKISENSLSISSIGVKFIREKLGTYKGKNVFIIGLGKMGRLSLNYILEEKVNKIYMANRNHDKVVNLSMEFPQVIPVDYKERYNVLEDTDILITSTSSPHVIIKAKELKERSKDLYIMDMAIPRDVDTKAAGLSGVHLYNVDDLQNISDYNARIREELSTKAEEIIKKDMKDFKGWLSYINVHPVIKSLKEKCEIIEGDTLEYIYKKIDLDSRDKKILEKMMNSALKRLIREPILKLKEMEDGSKREQYAKVLEDLFNIDIVE